MEAAAAGQPEDHPIGSNSKSITVLLIFELGLITLQITSHLFDSVTDCSPLPLGQLTQFFPSFFANLRTPDAH
jgi:hypothetical protein